MVAYPSALGLSLPLAPGVFIPLCFLGHHPVFLAPVQSVCEETHFAPVHFSGCGSVSHVSREAWSREPLGRTVTARTAVAPGAESGQRMDKEAQAPEWPGALEPKVWATFCPEAACTKSHGRCLGRNAAQGSRHSPCSRVDTWPQALPLLTSLK